MPTSLTSDRLTERAINAYAGIENDRLRQVMASVIRHWHECVKEVRQENRVMAVDARKEIVGVWRLVHSVEFLPDGGKHYPFGEDAIGYIVYTESGVMAVQIARKYRPIGHCEDASADYLAYFGRYEVNTEKELVRHVLEGQLFPGNHPAVVERKYRFYDDKLSLRPWNDGTDREILWQRS